MATTNSLTTTYAGEFAGEYISAALLSGVTIENGGITVKPNVKFKETLKKVSTDDIVKDASCDFDPTSTLTISEKVLQPEFQQVNLQLCKKDFVSDWEAISMGYSAHHDLPAKFSDFLISHVAAKVAQKTEQNIWRGVTATNGEFDGLTTLLSTDADLPSGQEVAGTSITSGNVIAQLGSIVDAIPSALYGSEDLNIYVSQNIYKAYVRALGGFGTDGLGAAGYRSEGTNQDIKPAFFDGIRVFMASGLSANTAVAAEKSNLFFGTGLLADHNEVKVIDMSDIDGSDNIRVVMRFTAGVQYGVVEDIVTYGITNSAN
ncbi:MAG: hypothetical protein GOVbin40013_34 [Prokaryotic dsDNA virus sp.]|jgi:hypothetical protein|nr:MAG: hypothetical protein GOVbin40013_34 [Prokaryotic dsDNA virus sp.]|tara:strand:+ start:17477 stop:18427 length:951 start_codon:yes stop_codon:yes gene_type:complete